MFVVRHHLFEALKGLVDIPFGKQVRNVQGLLPKFYSKITTIETDGAVLVGAQKLEQLIHRLLGARVEQNVLVPYCIFRYRK